ncbi:MAG TPA: CotH kinase family protein, partial [Saprospiraceae bacterium]|nr:CotH kinase family protein [Saprospiraceae bacterium]
GDDNYPAAHHAENKGSAHVRDAYIHNLADRADLHLDVRRGEKAIVYLNGEYWGVYDLREIPDDHDYTDYYYGQGEYDIQYILTWGNTWVEYGGPQAMTQWNQLYNYIISPANNLADPTKYKYVTDRYDVTSLVDYVLVNAFTVCSDWLNYNTGWWRGLNPSGTHQKWGYILWDNDATFGHYINYTGIPNTSPSAKICDPESLTNWSDPEGHIKVLKRLRTNPDFNQYYLSRQADLLKTVFSCDTMLQDLDRVVATIEPEMQRHADRWSGTYAEWQENVEQLRTFISSRCATVRNTFDDCYNLTGPFATVIRTEPAGAGTVQANSLHYKQLPASTWYHGNLVTKLTALPDTSQYQFSHWESHHHSFLPDSTAASTSLKISKADTLTAVFRKKSSSGTSTPAAALSASLSAYPSLLGTDLNVLYTLPEATRVRIRLFNVLGQPVATLHQSGAATPAGDHLQRLSLTGVTLPPGTYFLHVETDYGTAVQKLVKT